MPDVKPPPGSALPKFDPEPSLHAAVAILEAVGAPYALIGGVALWTYLPAEEQRFTKDVDVAVPAAWTSKIEGELRRRGDVAHPLAIGGVALRRDDLRVDFIDRSQHFAELYTASVDEARKANRYIDVGGKAVPIVAAEYLVVMKLAAGEDDDERDIERLARAAIGLDLRLARTLAQQHLGPAAANRLDAIARRVGHPEARPRYKS